MKTRNLDLLLILAQIKTYLMTNEYIKSCSIGATGETFFLLDINNTSISSRKIVIPYEDKNERQVEINLLYNKAQITEKILEDINKELEKFSLQYFKILRDQNHHTTLAKFKYIR